VQLDQVPLGAADGVPQHGLPAVVGPAQPFERGHGVVGLGLVEDEGVTGRQRLDLAVGQGVLADVVDLAGVEPALHHLPDEPGFALHGLPGVGVEGAFGDVAVDRDLGVLVALPLDASFPLGQVRGSPRAVQVVQGHCAGLHVGADAHLGGGADEDLHGPGAAGVEQLGLLPVVAG